MKKTNKKNKNKKNNKQMQEMMPYCTHTLELNLTRLAEELSLFAWGKDRTWCVVNILVAVSYYGSSSR